MEDSMTEKEDTYFKELAEIQADKLLHEDSYYEKLATPLKSAQALKAEERQQLCEYLQFKEIRLQLETAEKLIREHLKQCVSQEKYESAVKQFDDIPYTFQKNLEEYANKETNSDSENEKPIFLQDLCGFTDDTLIDCYKVAQELVNKKEYENACAILVFLTLMAPYVSSYWFAHGLCKQVLNKHQEAIEAFLVSDVIQPENPDIIYALAKSYQLIGETDRADHTIHQLKELTSHLSKEEKMAWEDKIRKF
jgi:hypothetical protein